MMDIKAEVARLVDAAVEDMREACEILASAAVEVERAACEKIVREYEGEEDAMQSLIADRIAARKTKP